MTDKELFVFAAKAVGFEIVDWRILYQTVAPYVKKPDGIHGLWNPLDDDADAFRLAFDLKINIEFGASNKKAYIGLDGLGAYSCDILDKEAAMSNVRKTIVKVAAEIWISSKGE